MIPVDPRRDSHPRSNRRVQFVHGLEGSPSGAKARMFAAHFDARTPAMDTSDFEACVRIQSDAIIEFVPDLLVGSSFGGAVVVELLRRELWRGPTLLLAQAALKRDPAARLPNDARVWLVHGLRDEIIDPGESRTLATTGAPDRVRLFEVDDDHALHESVRDGAIVRFANALVAADRSAH